MHVEVVLGEQLRLHEQQQQRQQRRELRLPRAAAAADVAEQLEGGAPRHRELQLEDDRLDPLELVDRRQRARAAAPLQRRLHDSHAQQQREQHAEARALVRKVERRLAAARLAQQADETERAQVDPVEGEDGGGRGYRRRPREAQVGNQDRERLHVRVHERDRAHRAAQRLRVALDQPDVQVEAADRRRERHEDEHQRPLPPVAALAARRVVELHLHSTPKGRAREGRHAEARDAPRGARRHQTAQQPVTLRRVVEGVVLEVELEQRRAASQRGQRGTRPTTVGRVVAAAVARLQAAAEAVEQPRRQRALERVARHVELAQRRECERTTRAGGGARQRAREPVAAQREVLQPRQRRERLGQSARQPRAVELQRHHHAAVSDLPGAVGGAAATGGGARRHHREVGKAQQWLAALVVGALPRVAWPGGELQPRRGARAAANACPRLRARLAFEPAERVGPTALLPARRSVELDKR